MTKQEKQLNKLIESKKNQFFDDINDTTNQGDFIGHCIIMGYELLKDQLDEQAERANDHFASVLASLKLCKKCRKDNKL